MKYILIVLLLLSNCIIGICQNPTEEEGYVNVEGGRIWYKKLGDGKGIPLVILHGGPGGYNCSKIPYYYALADERPVILYDQLGSGKSDRPGDTALWELSRFVDEMDSLRKALDLSEVHILGASWGGTVAVEYMVTKNPVGVKSVIFAGPLISTPVWMEDAKILLSQLPENLQDTIYKYEVLKDYNAPAYIAATDSFYRRFLRRSSGPYLPSPDCNENGGFNAAIYYYMWGPTEFNATGTLKNFDRTGELHLINQPILFMAGRYDEARPETMYKFQKLSKDAKVAIIEDSGHATIFDQPDQVIEVIREFLKGVELVE